MKNGYDHHDHQGIYTYNLSVPKRFTLDVPAKSPPYLEQIRTTKAICRMDWHKPVD